jgi:hypothetical protein
MSKAQSRARCSKRKQFKMKMEDNIEDFYNTFSYLLFYFFTQFIIFQAHIIIIVFVIHIKNTTLNNRRVQLCDNIKDSYNLPPRILSIIFCAKSFGISVFGT